jgi:hypothetical protein
MITYLNRPWSIFLGRLPSAHCQQPPRVSRMADALGPAPRSRHSRLTYLSVARTGRTDGDAAQSRVGDRARRRLNGHCTGLTTLVVSSLTTNPDDVLHLGRGESDQRIRTAGLAPGWTAAAPAGHRAARPVRPGRPRPGWGHSSTTLSTPTVAGDRCGTWVGFCSRSWPIGLRMLLIATPPEHPCGAGWRCGPGLLCSLARLLGSPPLHA